MTMPRGGCGLLRPVAFVMLLGVLKWLVYVPLCPWWFAPYRDFEGVLNFVFSGTHEMRNEIPANEQ